VIVYRALQDGAAGFLPKESTRSEVVSAVLRCAKGRDVLSPPEPPTRRARSGAARIGSGMPVSVTAQI
jgi:DNA-binding NarL/FixJ family response regulator